MKRQKPNSPKLQTTGNNDECPKKLNDSDYFNRLPNELIFKIFRSLSKKQLKRCSAVCQRWRQISSDARLGLWSSVFIQHDTISIEILAEIIEREIRKLTLFGVAVLDPEGIENPFTNNYVSKLRELVVVRPNITELSLALIVERSTQLVKLDISRCTLNQRICDAIGRNSELKLLLLNGCSGLNSAGISAILKGCQSIEELGLCSTVISTETMDEMTRHLSPSIQRLDIRRCGSDTLLDRHLSAISKACPRLTFLNIAGNKYEGK